MRFNDNLTTIILAAGKGTRMLSNIPKWQHTIGNFTLLEHAVYKALSLHSDEIIVVVAPEDSALIPTDHLHSVKFAVQQEARGTAHAVLAAKNYVRNSEGVVLILYCDTPLIPASSLTALIDVVKSGEAQVACIGFNESEPNDYGKFIISSSDPTRSLLVDIVEAKDYHHSHNSSLALANLPTRTNDPSFEESQNPIDSSGIRNNDTLQQSLCNSGIIAVSAKIIWHLLAEIDNNNAAQEYYLTSIVKKANSLSYRCRYVLENDAKLAKGANNKAELANLEFMFQELKRKEFLEQGVTIVDPQTTFFSLDTKIGNNVIIYPFNVINRGVTIHDNVVIESFSHITQSILLSGAKVGPYARITGNSVIGEQAQIGNFVEVKASNINTQVKIKHLSYIGDASIGYNTNIGAGTIICNYDGYRKHKTSIGSNSFIGSNVTLISPITIGDQVTIGAGSVIVKSVANNSLALARSMQIDKPDWKPRRPR